MIGRNPDAGGHALHQGEPIAHAGAALSQAKAVMILLHGRGASADGILSLAEAFADPEIAYFAPQAAGHSFARRSALGWARSTGGRLLLQSRSQGGAACLSPRSIPRRSAG
jgi:hypothetical protein